MPDLSNNVTLKFISPYGNIENISKDVPGLTDQDMQYEIYENEFLEKEFSKGDKIPTITSRSSIEIDEELDTLTIPEEIITGYVDSVDLENFEVNIVFNSEEDKIKDIEATPWNYVANFVIDEDVPEIVAVEFFDKKLLAYQVPTIQIKYHKDKYPGLMDVWRDDKGDLIDLRCAENVVLDKGEYKLIPLGFSAKLPPGYHAEIYPRSSTFKKFHIIQVNSVGIIDNSYCGEEDEWYMPVYAVEDTIIQQNDRICQLKLVKNQQVEIEEVKFLEDENRGGFGSTGEGSDDAEKEEVTEEKED